MPMLGDVNLKDTIMKIVLWIIGIIFLIGLLVVLGFFNLFF